MLLLSDPPVPWQEFVEAALGYVGDPGEDVSEPCERIDRGGLGNLRIEIIGFSA